MSNVMTSLFKMKKGDFKIPSYKCQKCGKTWHGWAQADICPDCGGKLEEVKEEKKIKENVEKFTRFK
jgi:rRNA maturation endonuclease Nob1